MSVRASSLCVKACGGALLETISSSDFNLLTPSLIQKATKAENLITSRFTKLAEKPKKILKAFMARLALQT